MADIQFLNPYQVNKLLSWQVNANPLPRPNAMSQMIGSRQTTTAFTANFDREFALTNVMGQFVAPNVDATALSMPSFSTSELMFGYIKEGVNPPDITEIMGRQFGQAYGQEQNIRANYEANVAKRVQKARDAVENVFELISTQMMVYAAYTTDVAGNGIRHPKITYTFNRTKLSNVSATTQASRDANVKSIYNEVVPEVDLTTLKANTVTDVGGGLSWDAKDNTSGTPTTVTPTNAVSPIQQVQRMIRNCKYRAGACAAVFMADNAWALYVKDMQSDRYKELRTQLTTASIRLDPMLIQKLANIDGLTLVGYAIDDMTQAVVPVYTYNGFYHDRDTMAKTKYFPDGYVIAVPPASNQLALFGRIHNMKADYMPMELFINYWRDEKSGEYQYELEQQVLVAPKDVNAIISWKVCSSNTLTVL